MSQTLEIPTGKAPKEPSCSAGKKIFLGCIVLILLMAGAVGFFLFQGRLVSTQNTLNPDITPVISPVGAPLTSVLATSGMQVKKGDVLARFDLSEYRKQLPYAQALVRGVFPTAQETGQMVEEAQNAEGDMVNRIALARQEEKSKLLLMEELSVAHARALLQLRGLQSDSPQRARAQQVETQARQQLESARTAYEHASRGRMAVETTLQALRSRRLSGAFNSTGMNPNLPTQEISDVITAPEDGHIIGEVPTVGQVIQKGTPVFTLLPEHGTIIKAASHVPHKDAVNLETTTPVFLVSESTLLFGSISQIIHDGDMSILAVHLNAEGEDFDTIVKALESGKVKMVFWPKNWLQEHVPVEVLGLLSYL